MLTLLVDSGHVGLLQATVLAVLDPLDGVGHVPAACAEATGGSGPTLLHARLRRESCRVCRGHLGHWHAWVGPNTGREGSGRHQLLCHR